MLQSKRGLLTGGGIVIVAIVAVVAWWLISPLFIDKTVEEEFPFAFQCHSTY